jgi:hypothetical protein
MMMFEHILKTLSENGKSGHAYNKVIEQTESAMKEDGDRAAGYLLLKILADRFIETTGRTATTAIQTENEYKIFANHVGTLSNAYVAGDPARISDALNKVSLASLEPIYSSFPTI